MLDEVAKGWPSHVTADLVAVILDDSEKVSIDGQGKALVETAMTDIGTGSYTILAQVTAEMLGLRSRT